MRAALLLVACGLLNGYVSLAAKGLANRPRPSTMLAPVPQTSFPSGHAFETMAGWLALLAFVLPMMSWAVGRVAIAVSALCLVLVGISRVALNVHYPSDVLAGWALAYLYVLVCLCVSALRPKPVARWAFRRSRAVTQPGLKLDLTLRSVSPDDGMHAPTASSAVRCGVLLWVSLVLAPVGSAAPAVTSAGTPWFANSVGNATQVVSVVSTGGSNATMDIYQRTAAGWQALRTGIPTHVGSAGMAPQAKSGVPATPMGVYSLDSAFGTAPNPGTGLPYTQVAGPTTGGAATTIARPSTDAGLPEGAVPVQYGRQREPADPAVQARGRDGRQQEQDPGRRRRVLLPHHRRRNPPRVAWRSTMLSWCRS